MTGRAPESGSEPFGTIDPKLTVFALANGMDLSKGVDYRRLEWFTEGFERGILIRRGEGDRFELAALTWKSGGAEKNIASAPIGSPTAAELSRALADAIEVANAMSGPD